MLKCLVSFDKLSSSHCQNCQLHTTRATLITFPHVNLILRAAQILFKLLKINNFLLDAQCPKVYSLAAQTFVFVLFSLRLGMWGQGGVGGGFH
jgi:hypothetical protein